MGVSDPMGKVTPPLTLYCVRHTDIPLHLKCPTLLAEPLLGELIILYNTIHCNKTTHFPSNGKWGGGDCRKNKPRNQHIFHAIQELRGFVVVPGSAFVRDSEKISEVRNDNNLDISFRNSFSFIEENRKAKKQKQIKLKEQID